MPQQLCLNGINHLKLDALQEFTANFRGPGGAIDVATLVLTIFWAVVAGKSKT
jgi:hypothetical protein